jgi:hypothetical protein
MQNPLLQADRAVAFGKNDSLSALLASPWPRSVNPSVWEGVSFTRVLLQPLQIDRTPHVDVPLRCDKEPFTNRVLQGRMETIMTLLISEYSYEFDIRIFRIYILLLGYFSFYINELLFLNQHRRACGSLVYGNEHRQCGISTTSSAWMFCVCVPMMMANLSSVSEHRMHGSWRWLSICTWVRI